MKIAQVIPLLTVVPPVAYGGIERIVEFLSVELANQGHEVTVYTATGSTLSGNNIKLKYSAPFPTFQDLSQNRKWEIDEWLNVIADQSKYDLIHFHYESRISNCTIDNNDFSLINYINTPNVSTFHNNTHIDPFIEFYKKHEDLWKNNYVFISEDQRSALDFLPNHDVVYNGMDIQNFEYNENPDDYLLFIGRVTREKGTLEAIKIAKKANKKLIIAAKTDPMELDYFENEIKPLVDNEQIIFVGEINFEQKINYYKNASALLFPIQWNEPFGLVMIEAMACGTPVIATKRGSVPEVIVDGVTGYVSDDIDELALKVNDIKNISRKACRDHVEKNFTKEIMINNYLKVYNKLLNK